MNKQDMLYWSAWLLILLAGMMALTHYIVNVKDSCVTNPLEFYVSKLKAENPKGYVISGSVSVIGRYNSFLIPFGDGANKTVTVTSLNTDEVTEENYTINFNFSKFK